MCIRDSLNTFKYNEQKKVSYETLKNARKCKKRDEKFKTLISGNDKASEFYKENFARMFGYIQNRIPEISNDITSILKHRNIYAIIECIGVKTG